MSILYGIIFGTKSIVGKGLIFLATLLGFIQISTPSLSWWEKTANISIAIFVLGVGIYILWKEYQKKDTYMRQQNDDMMEMAKNSAKIAEASTRATENSTQAIRSMTQTQEKLMDRMDKLFQKVDKLEAR